MHLNVNEMFGPTIQGEGPNTGKQAVFLRLAGCNLSCQWCDTPYSWDWERYNRSEQVVRSSVEVILGQLRTYSPFLLIITGGEPMSQQRAVLELVREIPHYTVQIETNGTIAPTEEFQHYMDERGHVQFVVSPKLSHSGDPLLRRINGEALDTFVTLSNFHDVTFKFVAGSVTDLDEIATLTNDYSIDSGLVYVMPEGATRAEHLTTLTALAEHVIDRGWNISTRLHVLIWDNKRGV